MAINKRIVKEGEILTLKADGRKVRNVCESDHNASCQLWLVYVDDPDTDFYTHRSNTKELS